MEQGAHATARLLGNGRGGDRARLGERHERALRLRGIAVREVRSEMPAAALGAAQGGRRHQQRGGCHVAQLRGAGIVALDPRDFGKRVLQAIRIADHADMRRHQVAQRTLTGGIDRA